ncbi:hypothetical protein T265_14945, partial [Opisthorchis viverrini]
MLQETPNSHSAISSQQSCYTIKEPPSPFLRPDLAVVSGCPAGSARNHDRIQKTPPMIELVVSF